METYTQEAIEARAHRVGVAGAPLTDLDRLGLLALILSAMGYLLPGCAAHVQRHQRVLLPWIKRGMPIFQMLAWLDVRDDFTRSAFPVPPPRTRPAPALEASRPFTAVQLTEAARVVHLARKDLTPLEQLGLVRLARMADGDYGGDRLHSVEGNQTALLDEACMGMALEKLARLGQWHNR